MYTILIVDDNPSDREGIKEMIPWSELGIRIVGTAINGMDGVRKAAELQPDFILTDVSMPLMDGIRMAGVIRESQPEIRFVFMSCFDEFNYVKSALHVEAHGYILKPIQLAELEETLLRAVRARRTVDDEAASRDLLLRQLKDNLPLLQTQFFLAVIQGKLADPEEISARIRFLELEETTSGRLMTAVVASIDRFQAEYAGLPVEQKYVLSETVKLAWTETVQPVFPSVILRHEHHQLECLVFLEAPDAEPATERLLAALDAFQTRLASLLSLEVTIGVGEFTTSTTRLPEIYEGALHAVKSRFYTDGNRIILAVETMAPNEPKPVNLQTLKSELAGLLESGRAVDIRRLLAVYFEPGQRYPESYFRGLTLSFAHLLELLIAERSLQARLLTPEIAERWSQLAQLDSAQAMTGWLEGLLTAVAAHLNEGEDHRYASIIEALKERIETHYRDIENMEDIVGPHHISASHANYLFRKYTGQTLFDYLIHVKMEEAKRLLGNPFVKIYEVSELVGYKSKSYFGSVFKSYTGLTPKQYMDKHARVEKAAERQTP